MRSGTITSHKTMKMHSKQRLTSLLCMLLIAFAAALGSMPMEAKAAGTFDLSAVPAYSGAPTATVNQGVPFFDASVAGFAGEYYSPLDGLGRCGACLALVGPETMPTQPRGQIGDVRPTGWHVVKYDWVDQHYLYNRCHLIGYQLTGENANPNNLITGTRYMNTQGMEPFESLVAGYVKQTGNHVLYRSTPVFIGNNLVAYGVLLEAISVEDGGKGIRFNEFCYNVEPGIVIDYATGASSAIPGYVPLTGYGSSGGSSGNVTRSAPAAAAAPAAPAVPASPAVSAIPADVPYIGNSNSGVFHDRNCASVGDMAEHNKVALYSIEAAIAQGFRECQVCHPATNAYNEALRVQQAQAQQAEAAAAEAAAQQQRQAEEAAAQAAAAQAAQAAQAAAAAAALQAQQAQAAQAAPAPAAGTTYLCNKRSMKFHYSWCEYGQQIADHNRLPMNSREEAINAGFKPCKVCNP